MAFILITGECEVIGSETTVKVFATYKEAQDAMVKDAKNRAWNAGIPEDELDDFIDCIDDDGGFILDMVGWQIREIPGLFVPEDDARWVRSALSAADEAETHFDATEAALEACRIIDKYV